MTDNLINSQCPTCGPVASTVTDSRPTSSVGMASIRRRRKCSVCGQRFTTFEIFEGHFKDAERAAKKHIIKTLLKTL